MGIRFDTSSAEGRYRIEEPRPRITELERNDML